MNNTEAEPSPQESNSPKSSEKSANPLLTSREIALINAASTVEHTRASDDSKSYASWFLAVLSLPYKDPGNVPVWERTNGKYKIQIVPDFVDGTAHYPYGSIPRMLMIWMSTQAILTKSPVLDVSNSLDAFVQELGFSRGGKQRAAVMDQMNRLFGAGIKISSTSEQDYNGETARRLQHKNFFVVESSDVLFTKNDEDGQQPLWGSTITLSSAFYAQIQEQAFPIFTEALKMFRSSPIQTDIYLFLVHRLLTVETPTKITWDSLNSQFGGQYERTRAFKAVFVKHLNEVAILYPEANYEITKDYFILYRSKKHVPPKTTKRKILNAGATKES